MPDSQTPMPVDGEIVGEKYRVEGTIGSGGMGVVYEAVHSAIGKRVAIKFLHPDCGQDEESLTRFRREAQATAAVGHRGIVDIHDMGVTEGGLSYLVMELLEGKSLAQAFRPPAPLELTTTAYVSCQVLSALTAAHRAGVVHRDLKPENIFLVETGAPLPDVKLLDFGISRIVGDGDEDRASMRVTSTGIVLGTPYYMSPEQAKGRSDVDPRADLFAMGVILYECLTGRMPFNGNNYNALLLSILNDNPVAPSATNGDLPPEIDGVVLKGLEKDRELRYQTASEMYDDLLPFVEEGALARLPPPSRLVGSTLRQHGLAGDEPAGDLPAEAFESGGEAAEPFAATTPSSGGESATDGSEEGELVSQGTTTRRTAPSSPTARRRASPLGWVVLGLLAGSIAVGALAWSGGWLGGNDGLVTAPTSPAIDGGGRDGGRHAFDEGGAGAGGDEVDSSVNGDGGDGGGDGGRRSDGSAADTMADEGTRPEGPSLPRRRPAKAPRPPTSTDGSESGEGERESDYGREIDRSQPDDYGTEL